MRVNCVAAQSKERSEHGDDEAERDARLVRETVHRIHLVRQNPLDVVNRDIQIRIVDHRSIPISRGHGTAPDKKAGSRCVMRAPGPRLTPWRRIPRPPATANSTPSPGHVCPRDGQERGAVDEDREAIHPATRAPAKIAVPTVTTSGPAGKRRESARRIPDPALAMPARPLSSAWEETLRPTVFTAAAGTMKSAR